MQLPPEEANTLRQEFDRLVNLTPAELRAWLETKESRKVGVIRRGETESVGRQSGRRILEIRATPTDELTDADYAHMRKVVGYVARHGKQEPQGDTHDSKWRYSLMNWGHDPEK